jgi:hypothetical protein
MKGTRSTTKHAHVGARERRGGRAADDERLLYDVSPIDPSRPAPGQSPSWGSRPSRRLCRVCARRASAHRRRHSALRRSGARSISIKTAISRGRCAEIVQTGFMTRLTPCAGLTARIRLRRDLSPTTRPEMTGLAGVSTRRHRSSTPSTPLGHCGLTTFVTHDVAAPGWTEGRSK